MGDHRANDPSRQARWPATFGKPARGGQPPRRPLGAQPQAGGDQRHRQSQLAEKVHESYVGNLPRLTLLAPDITEIILDGRLPKGVGLADFMKPWPGIWDEQRERLRALALELRPG